MNFLGELGIDLKLLIAQLINFGLLLLILTKFVYKPIMKRIEEDEKQLAKAKEETEDLQEEKEIFSQKKAKEIAKAKKQAWQIIKEAEDVAEDIKRQAKEEANREKQAVIKQIRERLKEIDNGQN
ncbi:hypothetical protein B6D52_02625 [Candidatus Parcubacteria bacterium 4484_255]|nr:MAG: hypothetical protein B6D52_02625 [Candidatus Parcubacteria bacterium 4484_255]